MEDQERSPLTWRLSLLLQIKLLKILALLGVADKAASENMYSVLADVLRKSDTGATIGNAILYEGIATITSIYPNPKLLAQSADVTSRFLKVTHPLCQRPRSSAAELQKAFVLNWRASIGFVYDRARRSPCRMGTCLTCRMGERNFFWRPYDSDYKNTALTCNGRAGQESLAEKIESFVITLLVVL